MLINKKHIYRNMLVACMGVSLLTGMNSCTDKFDEWNTCSLTLLVDYFQS